MKRLFFTIFWISGLFAAAAFSADFGLLVNAAPEYGSDQNGEGFGFTGTLGPWLSAASGEKLSFLAIPLTKVHIE